MEKEIFRKKSLDRVNSPEDLNSYLRVTNPPIWFGLIAVIALLVGVLVWGIFGKIETKANGVIVVGANSMVCYVSERDVVSVQPGAVVRVGKDEYSVLAVDEDAAPAEDKLNAYCMNLGGFSKGEYIYAVTLDSYPKEGNHACRIVLERISPISFLVNGSD